MDDAVKATIQLMDAPAENLKIRSSYNLGGISFTPKEIAEEIKKILPNFEMSYAEGDPRQAIADSWPQSIEDDYAQKDWNWKLQFDLAAMTKDMIDNLKTNKQ
jgi:nucleoside-diphosphate-sugar epimerase